ncbi:hypothetical protein Tco_0904891 [Tanacetum coccineum]
MSTPVFVDLEISTQADGAQISRVPDPVETETPESPHTVASPTSLPDSTPSTCHAEESEDSDTSDARSTSSDSTAPLSPDHPLTHTSPTLVPFLHRTARMATRVPPAMSPGLSASIAEVATMSDLAFHKRFRSSYETLPSSSPPDLPSRKRSRGTSELVEDDKDEDEEVEQSSDSDSESENAKDEGPTTEDDGPAAGDKGLAVGDEDSGMRVESLSLGGDEAVPEGQQRAAPFVETIVGEPLGLGYGALRCREIASREGQMPSVFKVDREDGRAYIDVLAYPPPAPPVPTSSSSEWSSGLLLVSPAPSIVPSPISSPMISLSVPSLVVSPATVEAEGFFTELGAQVEMQGGLIHDHTVQLGKLSPALFERYDRYKGELFTRSGAVRDEIFSHRYQLRSLEHKHERVAMTFGMENWKLRLQIAEERRARLDLAKIFASMRRGHEPRGDV